MMLGISNTTAVSSAFDLHCNHVSDTEKPHALGIQSTSQHIHKKLELLLFYQDAGCFPAQT
jgi:hypothetical protein